MSALPPLIDRLFDNLVLEGHDPEEVAKYRKRFAERQRRREAKERKEGGKPASRNASRLADLQARIDKLTPTKGA